mmetsp:Transcript_55329/g.123650  ORF Transcript_55329/g.123650 Transcript_55329/m.123650 type:complete len:207 (-) Transcript_55329:139-759(-)
MRYEYFQKLFDGWQEGSTAEVQMTDTESGTFDHFLTYAQCGRVDEDLDLDGLVKLLHMGDKYCLRDLISSCLLHTLCILENPLRLKSEPCEALAALLIFADGARESCPTLRRKVMEALLCSRGDALKSEVFLSTMAKRSVETLAELITPVAPDRDSTEMMLRPQKWRKTEQKLRSALWSEKPEADFPAWTTQPPPDALGRVEGTEC